MIITGWYQRVSKLVMLNKYFIYLSYNCVGFKIVTLLSNTLVPTSLPLLEFGPKSFLASEPRRALYLLMSFIFLLRKRWKSAGAKSGKQDNCGNYTMRIVVKGRSSISEEHVPTFQVECKFLKWCFGEWDSCVVSTLWFVVRNTNVRKARRHGTVVIYPCFRLASTDQLRQQYHCFSSTH